MITKHEVEKVIVVRPAIATPVAGDRLYDDSTNTFNQAVGSIGAYVDVAGSGNPSAFDSGSWAGQPFRFIQVRDRSGDNSPLYNRVLEQTQYIHGNCASGIELGGEGFALPSNSSWTLGAPNAHTSGNVSVTSNNLYTVQASAHGYRTDLYNGSYNTPTRFGRFQSPNWASTTIATENNRRDYTIKALVQDFNRQVSVGQTGSGPLAVALALDSASTTAGPTIAAIIAAGSGVTYTIGYDFNCTPVNLLVTDGMLQAFTELEAYATATVANGGLALGAGVLSVAPYALPDHCATGVVAEIAGDGNATADMIYFIALDEVQAYYDEVPNTKRRISVGMNQGSALTAVRSDEVSSANEGEGSARNLELMYKDGEDYRSYTSSRNWGANHVAYPNEILTNEAYDIFTIHSCHNRVATSGMPSMSGHLTAIAVVHTERAIGVTPQSTGVTNPQKTYLRDVLDAVAAQYSVEAVTL